MTRPGIHYNRGHDYFKYRIAMDPGSEAGMTGSEAGMTGSEAGMTGSETG
jgi:hypothetical protein